MMQQSRITILVCLVEPLIQAGVHALLANEPDMQVLAGDANTLGYKIDVVIADHAAAVGLVRERGEGSAGAPPIMVIAAQIREQAVRSAMEDGIRAIVLTSSPVSDLVAGVRALSRGDKYLCPPVARQLYQYSALEMLTNRQDQVLQLLARGLCNKSIARRLDIEVETVKVHVKAIMSKLHAHRRLQAVSIATERGLVSWPNQGFAA